MSSTHSEDEQAAAFASLAISLEAPAVAPSPSASHSRKQLLSVAGQSPASTPIRTHGGDTDLPVVVPPPPTEAFTPRNRPGYRHRRAAGLGGVASGIGLPRRQQRRRHRRLRGKSRRAAPDLAGLQHLSETLEPELWSAIVESSRSRNALTEFAQRQLAEMRVRKEPRVDEEKGGEEEEEEGESKEVEEMRTAEIVASALTLPPHKRWIPAENIGKECVICCGLAVEGNGIFCPKCTLPFCDECSCGMVREILESMQSDLSAFPPRCKCCQVGELILANFEAVLSELHPEVSPKGTKREVLVKQYTLIMIAAAFDRNEEEMTDTKISCPYCSCLTLYEDTESVVIIHCQNETCGKCFCWRCGVGVPLDAWARYCRFGAGAEDVETVTTHYSSCRSLDKVRKDVEDAISWGAVNRCPTCFVPGQKDEACTHIKHSSCPTWCYVCEQVFSGGHNNNWQGNSAHCPMYLNRIHNFDKTWPSDNAAAVQYYHKQKTLRALRQVVDTHGILSISFLKKQSPGVFGGFSLGQIMKIGVDEPLYIRRGNVTEPATPTTESILRSSHEVPEVPDSDIPPPPPTRRVVEVENEANEMPGEEELDYFVRGTLVYSEYTFEGRGREELAVCEGEILRVTSVSPDGDWVFVYHMRWGKVGYVPTSYLRPIHDLHEHQLLYGTPPTGWVEPEWGEADFSEDGLLIEPVVRNDPERQTRFCYPMAGMGASHSTGRGKILRRIQIVEASDDAVRRATGRN